MKSSKITGTAASATTIATKYAFDCTTNRSAAYQSSPSKNAVISRFAKSGCS